MASLSKSPTRAACRMVQSHEDTDSFEMIPPVAIVSALAALEDSRDDARVTVASSRTVSTQSSPHLVSKAKVAPREYEKKVVAWTAVAIVIAAVLGAFADHIFRDVFASDSIEDLRSEFKRDLESFRSQVRSEVEHELGVHLMAASAVQVAANKKATEVEVEVDMELELQHRDSEDIDNSGSMGKVRSATKTEPPIGSLPSSVNPSDDIREVGRHLQGGRFRPIDINSPLDCIQETIQPIYSATIASLGWIQNTVTHLHWMQPIDITTIASMSWIQNATVRLHRIQTIDMITITSLGWIQNTTVHCAINFANQHPFEVCAWCIAIFFLLYNCYRWGWNRGNERYCDRGVADKADDSSITAEDDKGGEESPEDSPTDSNPGPKESLEGVIMEHMFEESMAIAVNSPVIPCTYNTRGKRTRNSNSNSNINSNINIDHRDASTNTAAKATDSSNTVYRAASTCIRAKAANPSPPDSSLTLGNEISKQERLRRARINAQEFAAKDKQKLTTGSNAYTSTTTTPSKEMRLRRARINDQEFAAKDKQRLTSGSNTSRTNVIATAPSNSNVVIDVDDDDDDSAALEPFPAPIVPSPWTSKRARLQQARAKAKVYAEQDKQRLQKASVDSPWKKHRRNK